MIRVQVSCLAVRDGQLCLIRKLKPTLRTYNRLIPPGGHVEPFETLEDACRREMQEETGLVVGGLRMGGVVSFLNHVDRQQSVCFFFVAGDVQGELAANEPDKQLPYWVDAATVGENDEVPEYHRAFVPFLLKGEGYLNARVEWVPSPEDERGVLQWQIVEPQ